MKKIILIAVAMLAGCAQEPTEDANAVEQMVFDAWILEQVNGGVDGSVAVKQPNGMYVEFLADGDQNIDAGKDAIVWLKLNYTSTDLEGDIFHTRSEQTALQLGTFTPHTFYVPEMVRFDKNSNTHSLTPGVFYALAGDLVKGDGSTIKMTEGTKVKLYLPAHLAYAGNGFSDDKGFGGQWALEAGKHVIETLEVVDVMEDPSAEEKIAVKELARTWGIDVEEPKIDTIAEHFYVDTLTVNPPWFTDWRGNWEPCEKSYELDVDSEAKIWFIGRFLPTAEYPQGFIFDTNMDVTYDTFFGRNPYYKYNIRDNYNAMEYKPSRDKSSYITAFYEAIPDLRRRQHARMVFISDYGYGSSGSDSGATVIPPYTPLIFEIYIL